MRKEERRPGETLKHRKPVSAATFAAIGLSLSAVSWAAPATDKPVASINLPADSHSPAILRMSSAGHTYRLIFDTGASELVLDLARARRDLTAAPIVGAQAMQAKGLYGDLDVHYFQAGSLTSEAWHIQGAGQVMAVDLGAVVQAYGVDGVIGVAQLSQLNWHWDNRKRKLLGYPQQSVVLINARDRLRCEPLLDVEGMPGVALRVGSDEAQFVLDSGDLGESGNLHPQDREALEYRGAIQASATANDHTDAAGRPLPPLRITQIQNVQLGATRLDGLTFGEISRPSRLGRGFLSKFDEVVLDFENGKFCHSDIAQVEPDDMSYWRARAE